MFRYEPLASNNIRLLRPLGQNKDGLLCYKIKHVSLTAKLTYAALSYTWDVSTDSDPDVELDGITFRVRRNLHSALRQLHESQLVDKCLWVDAICINQGTDDAASSERSNQITLMKQIYERATKVLVWLGAPKDQQEYNRNKLAFKKMKYFKKLYFKGMTEGRSYRPWCKHNVLSLQSIMLMEIRLRVAEEATYCW